MYVDVVRVWKCWRASFRNPIRRFVLGVCKMSGGSASPALGGRTSVPARGATRREAWVDAGCGLPRIGFSKLTVSSGGLHVMS